MDFFFRGSCIFQSNPVRLGVRYPTPRLRRQKGSLEHNIDLPSLTLTAKTAGNGWLEDDLFPFWNKMPIFKGFPGEFQGA